MVSILHKTFDITLCIVPKRFCIRLSPETSVQGMEFNKTRIHWLINQKKKGKSSDEVSKDMKHIISMFLIIDFIRICFQMVERYWIICPMRELIMDHGDEFGAHRRNENGEWDSEFKQHIVNLGIKPILPEIQKVLCYVR